MRSQETSEQENALKHPKNQLGPEGTALVDAILADLAAAHLEPDSREAALIRTAGELRDRMAALEAALKEDGLRVVSATGSVRLHPAAAELRQHAIALSRVLAGVSLVDSSGRPAKSAQQQRAAIARWSRG
jgi:hypothetical protein